MNAQGEAALPNGQLWRVNFAQHVVSMAHFTMAKECFMSYKKKEKGKRQAEENPQMAMMRMMAGGVVRVRVVVSSVRCVMWLCCGVCFG
jgi:hypothetical protein